MKIQVLKDIAVEVEKPFARGVEEIHLHRWDELFVERIMKHGDHADIILENSNTLLWVPVAAFSKVS
jgi:hypothetical protein